MKKIIKFPKRKAKSIIEKKDDKLLKLYSSIEDETAILLKVKYQYESRYDNYYFLTRHGDWFPSLDTSNYIKVDRLKWSFDKEWIRPEIDGALSKLEYENIMKTKAKYLFIHVNNEALYRMATTVEEMKSYFVEADLLQTIYRIRLGNDHYMNLSNKPNRYGLIHDDKIGRYICILDELVRPFKKLNSVLFALTPEMDIIALVETKLDDGFTYNTRTANQLTRRQGFLYRELLSDECDADILKRLDYDYHKQNIALREMNKNR